ncbi:uncharacterized protein CTRU02_208413 [Colletotrichum truncatum]|uniref:Uncharacterized protein n=1 Tax=Colletotrichum truncatum TaxID=5467 RepID=A0ACC3YW64_COLTU|nr:uncharacterized protein CTRU02_10165 [Colletotrichum truncatum]KAF6787369.1 hypothetical protein CTRU02_10165 [Colletotrichum truncatum]
MYLSSFILLEALAAFVAAVPVDISTGLSHPSAQAFRDGIQSEDVNIEANIEDESHIQVRNEAVVDALDLDSQNAGAFIEYSDRRNTHNPPNNDFLIVPRANKQTNKPASKPATKSANKSTNKATQKPDLRADDKKFNRDKLRPDDAKYISNLDKLNSDNCGVECNKSLASHRSKLSEAQKELERNKKDLPGSRATRKEKNNDENNYQHDLNHLRKDRNDLGLNGEKSLASWHSVESAQKKAHDAKKNDAKKNN